MPFNLLVQDQTYAFVAVLDRSSYGNAIVGGLVIDYDNLDFDARLVSSNAVDALPQIVPIIIARDDDTDARHTIQKAGRPDPPSSQLYHRPAEGIQGRFTMRHYAPKARRNAASTAAPASSHDADTTLSAARLEVASKSGISTSASSAVASE